eukprot:CAMPEP_0176142864 /NCGR_PEP_ID=MMETSP0120_2-20121206/72701_1 /TAXON_ID=160619 /ORGANISM="Kryptoperidinium foliaceum, Strain CCMP 1326" /LENGTH=55 /DNA_ID=CAMNT_0017479135 /DNA_START=70 /DNA_END=234 /DNA_ORIENTATION=+
MIPRMFCQPCFGDLGMSFISPTTTAMSGSQSRTGALGSTPCRSRNLDTSPPKKRS